MPKKSKSPTARKKKPTSKALIKHPNLPPVQIISTNAVKIIRKYLKTFVILTLIYAVLYIIFVRGISGGLNLNSLRNTLDHTKGTTTLTNGLSLFGDLVGNATTGQASSVNAGVYQTILLIIISLALIWALRQAYNNTAIRARDAFYKGMYPVIPFLGVLLVLGLELIPMLIGGSIYSAVMTNGIAVGAFEKLIWALMFAALSLVS